MKHFYHIMAQQWDGWKDMGWHHADTHGGGEGLFLESPPSATTPQTVLEDWGGRDTNLCCRVGHDTKIAANSLGKGKAYH